MPAPRGRTHFFHPNRPHGGPQGPYNPFTGKFLPMGNNKEFIALTVVEEEEDYITCKAEDNQVVSVAKPYMLRKSPFDGETVDGVTYTYDEDDPSLRTAVDESGSSEEQTVTPSYLEDETILAYRGSTGINNVDWLDINTAGRCWSSGGGKFITVSYDSDTEIFTLKFDGYIKQTGAVGYTFPDTYPLKINKPFSDIWFYIVYASRINPNYGYFKIFNFNNDTIDYYDDNTRYSILDSTTNDEDLLKLGRVYLNSDGTYNITGVSDSPSEPLKTSEIIIPVDNDDTRSNIFAQAGYNEDTGQFHYCWPMFPSANYLWAQIPAGTSQDIYFDYHYNQRKLVLASTATTIKIAEIETYSNKSVKNYNFKRVVSGLSQVDMFDYVYDVNLTIDFNAKTYSITPLVKKACYMNGIYVGTYIP